MSTDTVTQYGKSERVNIAGCWIMTSYIMKQNRIVQSGDRNAGLVRSRKSYFLLHCYVTLLLYNIITYCFMEHG